MDNPINIQVSFGEEYYRNIWGTIHRHDYTESLAQNLIAKYGKCRILDIGTGCGHLVKILRERGCDAWGLEISDYALENSCCADYTRKGDIRDIPFGAGRFDVVHSQGVWGYFPKEDIQRAWKECNRVGKHQEHAIDTTEGSFGEFDNYLFHESRQWWKDQFYPKVLVTCPNHICKEYAFQRWIDNVKSFTYPNYDILVGDNSPNKELLEKYNDQVPIIHVEVPNGEGHACLRMTYTMGMIRRHFLEKDYRYWFNVEADNIPPVDAIERMLAYGGDDSDWISHAYPLRHGDEAGAQQGIGCSLLSRRLIENFDFFGAGDNTPDGWLWGQVKPTGMYKTMELWSYFKVGHLAE